MHTTPHGIMFHHFYGGQHRVGQGAMSADNLVEMLERIGRERIVSASEWLEKSQNNSLCDGDICFTFDDALISQYDIALPILKKYGITAFWFVFSSVVSGGIEMLEIYRKFRTTCFKSVDDFYAEFFITLSDSPYESEVAGALKDFIPENYLPNFSLYTASDRKFRYLRDRVLGKIKYDAIMDRMLRRYRIDVKEFSQNLWMREQQLRELEQDGHIVGLHSHTHPTDMAGMLEREQRLEYETNFAVLKKILNTSPNTMSHPCNSYNESTLAVLKDLGVTLGFRADMAQKKFSALEFPREDHAHIMKEMAL